MDTKWIPAAPLPDWKSWNNRARELAGFKGWLEKFASWLCLVHDSYAQEVKEAMNSAIPCGDCESRPSNSKPSMVSFTSAEFFWIL